MLGAPFTGLSGIKPGLVIVAAPCDGSGAVGCCGPEGNPGDVNPGGVVGPGCIGFWIGCGLVGPSGIGLEIGPVCPPVTGAIPGCAGRWMGCPIDGIGLPMVG